MDMAPLYIFLQLLLIHTQFSAKSGSVFLSKITSSSLSSAETLDLMIQEQVRICPYIPLCTIENSSVVPSTYDYLTPCCQKCSCADTCRKEGTCCPDFNDEDYRKRRTNISSEEKPQSDFIDRTNISGNVNEASGDMNACVKIQHGSFPDKTGVMMIASCPAEFKDTDVKKNCEANFDYSSSFNMHDHIPVTNTVSGVTYKNHFCEKCNGGNNTYLIFWNVWLKCKVVSYFAFPYIPAFSPFTFAEQAFLDERKFCDVVFDYDTLVGLNVTPTFCETEYIIDTCEESLSTGGLQKICSEYFLPVKGRKKAHVNLYRNLACMLCNGVKFKEFCPNMNYGMKYKFLLRTSFNTAQEIHKLSVYSGMTQNSVLERLPVVEKYFPNMAGEVHCNKGFVYDSKKDVCRQVMCPLYSFVSNGECVPIFRIIKGVSYQVLFQADVLAILKDENHDEVESAISISLDKLLLERIGIRQYEYFILKNKRKYLGEKDKNQHYLIILAIPSSFGNGDYLSVLKFINDFVLYKKQLDINISNGNTASKVLLSFNTSIKVHAYDVTRHYGFSLIKSNNGTENIKNHGSGTPFLISPIHLCHTVSLSDKDVKLRSASSIHVSRRFLEPPNFVRVKNKDKYSNFICLHHALNDVPESVSFTFLKDSANYKFIPRTTLRKNTEATGTGNSKTGDKGEPSSEKSVVATLVTIAAATFVVVVRLVLKRLVRSKGDTASNEETVISIALENVVPAAERSCSDKDLTNIPIDHEKAVQ